MRCIKCHRQLTREPIDGMGPVCAKRAKPTQLIERDLFGFDIERAVSAAKLRCNVAVIMAAIDAGIAVKAQFAAARRRLGVWA